MHCRGAVAALLAIVVLWTESVPAEGLVFSPVGHWRATDYRTGKPIAIIELREVHGELRGRIERVIALPNGDPNPVCTACPGNRRNKPVLGMEVIWGLKRRGNCYADGWALDPIDGKTYRLELEPTEGGRRLRVFGYIKMVVKIGRTEYWERIAGS